MPDLPCCVYMLRCSDSTLYTGWTVSLEHRLKAHNAGKGAAYTRCRRPVRLVYYEVFFDRKSAMKREYAIKQLTKKQKEELVFHFAGLMPAVPSQNKTGFCT